LNSDSKRTSWQYDAAILAILTLPFLLNDFANIFVLDYRIWLGIDYVFVKALPLFLIFRWVRRGHISYADLGVRSLPFGRLVIWTIAMTVLGVVLDQVGSRFFTALLPDTRLGWMPTITNPLLDRLDLSFGLLLVGIVEELIFRGLWVSILKRYVSSRIVPVVLSSLIFGLIHWRGVGEPTIPSLQQLP
jgi:uncharacterized protein